MAYNSFRSVVTPGAHTASHGHEHVLAPTDQREMTVLGLPARSWWMFSSKRSGRLSQARQKCSRAGHMCSVMSSASRFKVKVKAVHRDPFQIDLLGSGSLCQHPMGNKVLLYLFHTGPIPSHSSPQGPRKSNFKAIFNRFRQFWATVLAWFPVFAGIQDASVSPDPPPASPVDARGPVGTDAAILAHGKRGGRARWRVTGLDSWQGFVIWHEDELTVSVSALGGEYRVPQDCIRHLVCEFGPG